MSLARRGKLPLSIDINADLCDNDKQEIFKRSFKPKRRETERIV